MKEYPYWFKLIKYWVDIRNRTGLTIPFLIGAKTIINRNSTEPTVKSLLNEIKNSDIDEIIILNNCTDIGDYVLGLQEEYNPYEGLEVKNENNGKVTLIATASSDVIGKSFVEKVDFLDRKYEKFISEKKYSLNWTVWEEFNSNDIQLIMDAIEYYK